VFMCVCFGFSNVCVSVCLRILSCVFVYKIWFLMCHFVCFIFNVFLSHGLGVVIRGCVYILGLVVCVSVYIFFL